MAYILPPRYLGKGGNTGELEVFGEHSKVCSTFTCAHCCKVTFVQAGCDPAALGGFCPSCSKLICPQCVAKQCCNPWEKQMKKMEDRNRFLREAGLLETPKAASG